MSAGASPDRDADAAGDTAAGDTAAGDTAAGDTAAGDTAAGDTAAGDTAAGDTAAGDTAAGDTAAGNTAAGDTTAESTPRGPRRVGVCLGVALLALVLDVVSKLLVVADLPQTHAPKRLLGGILYLNQTRNSGAAFSLGTGFTVILTVVALAVVVVIARTASRLRSTGWAVALGLILGGALGNLGDRIFRGPGFLRGHVVDWLSLFGPYDKYWPIFNLADSAIVCGAILAALVALLGIDFDGRRTHRG